MTTNSNLLYVINDIGMRTEHRNTNSLDYQSVNLAIQDIQDFDKVTEILEGVETKHTNLFTDSLRNKQNKLYKR